jgi:short-subunit dehydrogenase
VALAATSNGARAGLIARGRDDLDKVLAEIGGRGAAATADVDDPPQLRCAIANLEEELGTVDILVANAGIGAYGPFAEVEPALIEKLVRVNVLGTMHAIRTVLPGMIERRRGHIVTIGSIAGRIGAPFEALYSATKFAQVGLTEALSVELSAHGIGVSMVNPGPVDTGFFDARGHPYDRKRPRPVAPEQVANAVIAAVERDRLEQYVARSLRGATVIRHLVPPLFRSGTRRAFRKELSGR